MAFLVNFVDLTNLMGLYFGGGGIYRGLIFGMLIGLHIWGGGRIFAGEGGVLTGFYRIINNARSRSSVFIVNVEHISHLVLVFLLLTLSR